MQNSYTDQVSRHKTIILIVMLLAMIVTACGFKLRGVADLSFKNLYIQGAKLTLSRDLERQLKANGVTIVQKSEDAEVLLELMSESSQKRIMSLSGGGLVREFELLYLLNFRIREANNPLWGPVQTIRGRRDLSYNDNVLLGKAEEEARLNLDMRNDAIRELLKRLTSFKPNPAEQ
jgi:LPS-assembly lipoprotein